MDRPTLEDQLRQATRHFTSRLPEDDVFRVGARLAEALAAAHGGSPARHPGIDPSHITLDGETPCLDDAPTVAGVREGLFELGALLFWLVTGEQPTVAWRLDPPAPPPLTTLLRRAALGRLLSQRADTRFETASQAHAALLAAAEAPRETSEAAWPLFRGDPGRSGCRAQPSSPRSFTPVWDALIGATVGSPVVTPTLVIVATVDGRVVFLDRSSGRVAHALPLGSAVESSPALTATHVVVGTDGGEIVAIHRQSGEITARTRLGDMVRSSPLTSTERVFVGSIEGREAGALVALSVEADRILWRRKLGAVFSSPALAGERILVGSDDERLYAVEAARGAVVWSTSLGGRVRATPAVAGDLAFVGTFGGRLAALSLSDGAVVWAREISHPLYSSPAVGIDSVVVGCHDGALHAFSRISGEPLFRAETRGPIVASPVIVGDSFVVTSTDGGLYLFDSAGKTLARHALRADGAQSSAALDGQEVWVGSSRGVHSLRILP